MSSKKQHDNGHAQRGATDSPSRPDTTQQYRDLYRNLNHNRSPFELAFHYSYNADELLDSDAMHLLSQVAIANQLRLPLLTPTVIENILYRVVLRNISNLHWLFGIATSNPNCAAVVQELHCHVNLRQETSPRSLTVPTDVISDRVRNHFHSKLRTFWYDESTALDINTKCPVSREFAQTLERYKLALA